MCTHTYIIFVAFVSVLCSIFVVCLRSRHFPVDFLRLFWFVYCFTFHISHYISRAIFHSFSKESLVYIWHVRLYYTNDVVNGILDFSLRSKIALCAIFIKSYHTSDFNWIADTVKLTFFLQIRKQLCVSFWLAFPTYVVVTTNAVEPIKMQSSTVIYVCVNRYAFDHHCSTVVLRRLTTNTQIDIANIFFLLVATENHLSLNLANDTFFHRVNRL